MIRSRTPTLGEHHVTTSTKGSSSNAPAAAATGNGIAWPWVEHAMEMRSHQHVNADFSEQTCHVALFAPSG